ncbi:MAG: YhcB family protein [Proteobacteria bacterium]|nr:YhcB family protein [Pseudomonadota bacterium]
MSDQLFYLFSAVLLGSVIGAMLMYFASGKGSNSTKTAELEDKLNNYQQNVVEHFEKTADLVDELTQSYKKVFDHLGESAKELMTEEQLQLQIEKRKGKKVTLEFLPDENEQEQPQNDEIVSANEAVIVDGETAAKADIEKDEHSYS